MVACTGWTGCVFRNKVEAEEGGDRGKNVEKICWS